MNLSKAPAQYDAKDEAQTRRSIENADKVNVKVGGPYDLQSPDGKWWRASISNLGVLTWTAL